MHEERSSPIRRPRLSPHTQPRPTTYPTHTHTDPAVLERGPSRLRHWRSAETTGGPTYRRRSLQTARQIGSAEEDPQAVGRREAAGKAAGRSPVRRRANDRRYQGQNGEGTSISDVG